MIDKIGRQEHRRHGDCRNHAHLVRTNILRLIVVETSCSNILFQFFLAHSSVIFYAAILLKELFRNDVDALISTLGRKLRRDQQFEWIGEI